MGQKYTLPDGFDQSDVHDLTPESAHSAELKPTSMVICINRGPKPVRDMFDAQTYDIPGHAKFRCEYQVAQHLQRRNIVPGTRNPNPTDSSSPQFVPWIAIIGIDTHIEPFTLEEMAQFGESVEGLNRNLLPSRAGREVQIAQTDTLRRQLPGAGVALSAGMGGGKPDQQVFGEPAAVEAALAKVAPGESMASQEAANAIAAGYVTPANIEQTSAPAPVDAQKPNKGGGRRR